MTATLLSLLNIALGITGALLVGYQFRKYSLGLTGNAIVGVFGSILMTKTLGRLGFDVGHIVASGGVNLILLIVLLVMSLLAGGGAVVLAKSVSRKLS